MSFCFFLNWIVDYAITKATPSMMTNMGWGTFLLYAVLTYIGVAFVYVCMPEFKGRSIESTDDLFQHSIWTMFRHAYPTEEEKVRHGAQDMLAAKMEAEEEEAKRDATAVHAETIALGLAYSPKPHWLFSLLVSTPLLVYFLLASGVVDGLLAENHRASPITFPFPIPLASPKLRATMAKRTWAESSAAEQSGSSSAAADHAARISAHSLQRQRDDFMWANGAAQHAAEGPGVHALIGAEQRVPTISRRVRACAACRKQKIKCIMDDRGPPCRRCEEKGLGCVLNKSLQALLNERLPYVSLSLSLLPLLASLCARFRLVW
ncbi:hypothetical protein VTK73DRAFT_3873 [Phialemonium thermophilum]|uniref:Zn(2)-C6 fungal-type domain-containing protein n=1 Tax=Phialemonium thermophilum TaxID=223376 RepID=A0ABR3VDW5_9PEZI